MKWADGGAPEGDRRDFAEARRVGRRLGHRQTGHGVRLPVPFDVRADGVIEYQHVIVPTGFTEDRWIQAAEERATEREVVHHLIAFVREPKSKWFRGQARTVKMGDHPVIWTNPRYKARNVDFQFGHKADLLRNRAFTTLFLNAIRWASER